MNKKGYIAVNIENIWVKKLLDWSKKNISDKDLIYSEANDKKIGGNVLKDAHVTLFFGIKDLLVDKDEIKKILGNLEMEYLEITGVNSFNIKKYNAKVLYFKIDDKNKKMEKIHNLFLKFPHYKKYQKKFIPHITIAYVRDTFNEKKIKFDFKYKLFIKNIEYLTLD